MDSTSRFSEALAEVACFADQPRFGLSLQDIAEVTENSVPDFDHVSITLLDRNGRFQTGASTSPLAIQLDNTQYAVGEGPCLQAIRSEDLVSVPHLASERRWPSYVREAVAMGVKSHLTIRFCPDGETTAGSINLYSTTTEHISRDSEAMAQLFGFQALTGPPKRRTVAAPSPVLVSLRLIEQALGIVMKRFDLGPSSAFDYLDESATRANLDLHDFAQKLVYQDGIHPVTPDSI